MFGLGFLDMARGVGALMVLFFHLIEMYPSESRYLGLEYVHLGEVGVACFFIISGFVIPISLERHQSLPAFFVARMWRLLPTYWLVLTVVFAISLCGIRVPFESQGAAISWWTYLVNLTTFQDQLGVARIVRVSWTIVIEIEFYIVAAFIFWLKPRSKVWPAVVAALVVLALFVFGWILHKRIPVFLFGLILLALNGQVIYYAWMGRISRLRAWVVTGVIWGVCMAALMLRDQVSSLSDIPLKTMMCSWTLGYFIFGFFLAFPKLELGILKYVGRISYSFYLLHVSVVGLTAWLFPMSWYAVLFCVGLSALVAKLCYDWVEMPCVRLGSRLLKKWGWSPDSKVA